MHQPQRYGFTRLLQVALVLGMLLVVGQAAVADDEPLQLTLTQFEIIAAQDEDHPEQMIPFIGDVALPGTVIEYQLVAKNTTTQAIGDIILRLFVPQGTHYLNGLEQYDRSTLLLQFSIDGGQTFRTPPIRYIVQLPDGSQTQAIAGPEMYSELRLVFLRPLAPDEEVRFSYRVAVD